MAHTDFKIDFISVGPQKTGTTWLYENLRSHPDLCFPKNVKETMFFDRYFEQGLARYKSYFHHCQSAQSCCEVAPTYFDAAEVPSRIYDTNPNCKIIIHLRKPSDRAFSLYCHHLRKGRVPKDFTQAVKRMPRILKSGHYQLHVPRWLELFGSDNILFLTMDEVKREPERVLAKTCAFLEISRPAIQKSLHQKVNQASMPKFFSLAKVGTQVATFLRAKQFDWTVECIKKLGLKKIYTGGEVTLPRMTPAESEFLAAYYENDIRYIEGLLNVSLPEWRIV